MKFTALAVAAIAMVASLVSAQDPAACTLCLQKAVQALPACANVKPTAGSVSLAYAICLCSSLSGNWADACTSQCGSVSAFKSSYASNIQAAGLICGSTQGWSGLQ